MIATYPLSRQIRTRGTVMVQLIGLILVVAVTIGAFALIGEGFSGQPNRFWITLAAIVVAEIVTLGFGIMVAAGEGRKDKTFPLVFAAIGMIIVYDICVAIVSLLALTELSDGWLIALQLIVLVGFILGMIAMSMGRTGVERQETVDRANRAGFEVLANEARQIQLVVRTAQYGDSDELRGKVETLCEEFEYAMGESLPGGEAADSELGGLLRSLHGMLSDGPDTANPEWSSNVDTAIDATTASLQRRELVMQRLKNQAG